MQLLQRIQDLHVALEILLDECNDIDKRDFLPNSVEATGYAKMMLSTIIYGFNLQKDNQTMNQNQGTLLSLLINLQLCLQETKIIIENKKECSMWD